MTPKHEAVALSVAVTLLKQVRRVLRHAQDHQSSTIKLQIERILVGIPPEVEAPEPDDQAFFGALEATHGADFAAAANEGDKPTQAQPSSTETALRAELEDMRRRLAELESK
jgi:hypothetical protein